MGHIGPRGPDALLPPAGCASSKPHLPRKSWHLRPPTATVVGMHTTIVILVAALRETSLSRASRHLENLALRQQVAILKRAWRRPRWREALVIVRPETVIGWHRRGVRSGVSGAVEGDGHRGECHGAAEPMAKSVRRKGNRLDRARLSGSRHRSQRAPSPTNPLFLPRLLPRVSHATGARQGYARRMPRRVGRRRKGGCVSSSRRTSSPGRDHRDERLAA